MRFNSSMAADDVLREGARLHGTWEIGAGRKVSGQLSIEKQLISLALSDQDFFQLDDDARRHVHGELDDLTKVTLAYCLVTSELGFSESVNGSCHLAELDPAYAISGHRHFDPDEKQIAGIEFGLSDAHLLFHDVDAFGIALRPEELIDRLASTHAELIGRAIPIGSTPEVVYFAGRRDVVSADTPLGSVSVRHHPRIAPLRASRGIAIDNVLSIRIEFVEPNTLAHALEALLRLTRYFGLIAGRPQGVPWTRLWMAGDDSGLPLDMYWPAKPDPEQLWRAPHPASILLDPIEERGRFEEVLVRWLDLDGREGARSRFFDLFEKQSMFGYDRMVGAANMFDVLPDEASPAVVALGDEVVAAREEAKRAFRALAPSDERDSVLNALGRLGKRTLRQKIQHRAAIVANALPDGLDHLAAIVDEAVRCRNHYVHGSPGSFDYEENWQYMAFLTRALEFLFAASDLIEAGWDARQWRSAKMIHSHPFGTLLHEWPVSAAEVVRLRSLRSKSR